ncbi:hypothetical protein EST38_g1037 [Candolleomyces aberdarensis]|uniref:Riboflavin kinase n=1 Tax=Candolleomyces aberdarensis TaxID=2316362 RepID=A0A4Q2DZ40_9AGAR|nr:hypothetical protein EST38_g1037 [Candolleomyces aberdarensis]
MPLHRLLATLLNFYQHRNALSTARPLIIGPSTGLEAPYPLQMEGKVISGFGRGSKELGIPTANLPVDDSLTPWIADIKSGVYFGWASLRLPPSHPNYPTTSSDTTSTTTTALEAHSGFSIYPMVMSIGYNPFYNNTVRSAEVHVLHEFEADFYGVEMRLLIAGFIREEKDYPKLKALIEDIKVDCDVARKSLDREAWALRETGKGTLDGSWLVRETAEAEQGQCGVKI